jgi:DNA-binding FadR family transcriptional regulator
METLRPSRQLLSDQVFELLYRNIENGSWPVGERIPTEPELVEAFHVGRNTIREAVKALVHTGMLETRQGDGTYVRHQSGLDAALGRRIKRACLRDIVEVRRALELQAVQLAAVRRTEADLRELDRLLARQQQAVEEENCADYLEADIAFHIGISAAAHNSVLFDLYRDFEVHLRSAVAANIVGKPLSAHSHFHTSLLEAIRAGEPRLAERLADDFFDALLAHVDENPSFE